mmetsp:Transcript_25573/g.84492  ORF Transcript_25573/g.84492 Transcript_25573/m.84492 type:complete len:223 (-) Transcript_25573:388-1056(-)
MQLHHRCPPPAEEQRVSRLQELVLRHRVDVDPVGAAGHGSAPSLLPSSLLRCCWTLAWRMGLRAQGRKLPHDAPPDLDQSVSMDGEVGKRLVDWLPDEGKLPSQRHLSDKLFVLVLHVPEHSSSSWQQQRPEQHQINHPQDARRQPDVSDLEEARFLQPEVLCQGCDHQVRRSPYDGEEASEDGAEAQGDEEEGRREAAGAGPVSRDGSEQGNDWGVVEEGR